MGVIRLKIFPSIKNLHTFFFLAEMDVELIVFFGTYWNKFGFPFIKYK
jgi:hypothetical protein